jgi:antitoxin (DNA-binding transcriptional repressor) of toxin-antitoxin stability system
VVACVKISVAFLQWFWYSVSMTTITLDDMQRDLPGYLLRVRAGETLLIMQADQPIAELKPVTPSAKQPRPFGLCAGEFTVPADFDDPLPEEILAEIEGR